MTDNQALSESKFLCARAVDKVGVGARVCDPQHCGPARTRSKLVRKPRYWRGLLRVTDPRSDFVHSPALLRSLQTFFDDIAINMSLLTELTMWGGCIAINMPLLTELKHAAPGGAFDLGLVLVVLKKWEGPETSDAKPTGRLKKENIVP